MKLIDQFGEMELDNNAVATTDDMNSIAGVLLSAPGFERWCAEGDREDGDLIEMGDTCETVVEKIREWANEEELEDDGIVL